MQQLRRTIVLATIPAAWLVSTPALASASCETVEQFTRCVAVGLIASLAVKVATVGYRNRIPPDIRIFSYSVITAFSEAVVFVLASLCAAMVVEKSWTGALVASAVLLPLSAGINRLLLVQQVVVGGAKTPHDVEWTLAVPFPAAALTWLVFACA